MEARNPVLRSKLPWAEKNQLIPLDRVYLTQFALVTTLPMVSHTQGKINSHLALCVVQ
jgi:hypothetical protein